MSLQNTFGRRARTFHPVAHVKSSSNPTALPCSGNRPPSTVGRRRGWAAAARGEHPQNMDGVDDPTRLRVSLAPRGRHPDTEPSATSRVMVESITSLPMEGEASYRSLSSFPNRLASDYQDVLGHHSTCTNPSGVLRVRHPLGGEDASGGPQPLADQHKATCWRAREKDAHSPQVGQGDDPPGR